MISITEKKDGGRWVVFCRERNSAGKKKCLWFPAGREMEYCPAGKEENTVYIRLKEEPELRRIREGAAFAASLMKRALADRYGVDIRGLVNGESGAENGQTERRKRLYRMETVMQAVTEGLYTGAYEVTLPDKQRNPLLDIKLYLGETARKGTDSCTEEKPEEILSEAVCLAETQTWVRDMVNAPGNLLTPMDFAREVMKKMQTVPVECELLVFGALNDMGLHALTSVGSSSENPPCMLILRYCGKGGNAPAGLVGKGVTCDTGGYCLKPAGSMQGIKGDMAGGAAVAGALYALAEQKASIDVTAAIPMCENRISPLALVPGDVIDSYGGKRIEIRSTDAEGRLIMADAVSYLVKKEGVRSVIDIATLTGSVVSALGFTTAGLVTDDETLYRLFQKSTEKSGERYWRLPFYEEQEDMLKSDVADIKNLGEEYCGTVTAGLFVRAFAEGKPWLHLDIAGSAWTDRALYEGQPKGATGAGMTSIYHMLKEGGMPCF